MFAHIESAANLLQGVVHHTPVARSATLNSRLSADIFFKCENLQKIGAFKFRGACNAILRLSDKEKARGVLAYSSGNHAQAVAVAGKKFGLNTIIVMPKNAPAIKRAATNGYGATVVTYDPETEVREEVAMALKDKHGYTLIPPYDHLDVIAGQGTAAKELIEEIGQLDLLLVPCGGGGLLSGSAIAAKALSPKCQVIGIEPAVADDATRSFYSGKLHSVNNPPTIADGVRTPYLGDLTFPLVLDYVDGMKTVSEKAIMDAVKFHFYRMKQVVEPSGALGLAALLSGAVKATGKIGVIISGGNIDGATMTQILQQ